MSQGADLRRYLNRQRWILSAFRFIEGLCISSTAFFLLLSFAELIRFIVSAWSLRIAQMTFLALATSSGLLAVLWVWKTRRRWLGLSLTDAAREIELQAKLFRDQPSRRTELMSAASFLEEQRQGDSSTSSRELRAAHIQIWNTESARLQSFLVPRQTLFVGAFSLLMAGLVTISLSQSLELQLPSRLWPWMPTAFESRQPYPGALWRSETGSLTGIAKTEVRFQAPKLPFSLKPFLFIKIANQWAAIPCHSGLCQYRLVTRGQYAVGSLFFRSALYPLQVMNDENPKSSLLLLAGGEWVPAVTVEAVNKKSFALQMTASDDIRVEKIELRHRVGEQDEVLSSWSPLAPQFKGAYEVRTVDWKGGEHHLYLRVFDYEKFSDSAPVVIQFADENTLREKRLQDLRALLDEWVQVLADLLETEKDKKLAEGILSRLSQITYPSGGDDSLINAYIKELQLLSQRIERWARYAVDFSGVADLVQRTEKQILYGLSLIFQEKTGGIEDTAASLNSAQNDMNDLLEKIKKGQMDLNSKELEEAFKTLAEKLAELQKKIQDLPQGPEDQLLNREALEAQVQESESLLEKIEAIRKQMAAGDKKGALRELESLLNQLTILSKEMERNLGQWKSNLDKGSMQASQRFAKKLEELRKQEEDLAKQTEKLKEKAERLESESQKSWKPMPKAEVEKLRKDYSEMKRKQQKVAKDFKEAVKEFDQSVQGSELEQVMRSENSRQMEEEAADRMMQAEEALGEQQGIEALSQEREVIDLLKKATENQQQIQKQMQSQSEGAARRERHEKVEILSSEGKGQKERRRKIMESLKQKVEEQYQKSHEQYFEDLLQR